MADSTYSNTNYERKDLEDKILCAKCGILVEETLLLTCEHNLCLPCAAKNLQREENKNIHKYKTVVCDICYTQTALDPSSAQELLQFLPQSQSPINNKSQSRLLQTSSSNINDSLLNMSVTSKSQNINQLVNAKKEFCKDHGEELTYYCFDCLCRCICSECVVHGTHRNHEVMNVKRAYPLIVEKSEDLLYQVQSKISEIANVQHSLEIKKKELVDNTSVIKQEMAKVFEEIRSRLQKKEKEIMDKAEVFLQEHLQEMNTYTRVLQSKVFSLNKTIDSINSNIGRRDEVTLLNFYSESRNRIAQTVETEIPDIPDFNTIYNMKVNINNSSFENLISNLNAIHVEISSMKGFDVSKVTTNTQKFVMQRDLYGAKDGRDGQMNTSQSRKNLGGAVYSPPSHNTSYDFSRNNNQMNVSFKSLNSQAANDDYTERIKNKLKMI